MNYQNNIIYEVNLRQYTPEGTFKAFIPHIPKLKKLGVDILWFMPIYPIGTKNRKGSMGSYYSISDYTAINRQLGTLAQFKKIVETAHSLGMKVVLDMVANHTSWNHKWLKEGNTDWYECDEDGNPVSPYDWTDTAKLNYNNKEMRQAMTKGMLYWIEEIGIDGYRQDMAGLVPLDFWKEAISALRAVKPDIFMLGEVEDAAYHAPQLFDATYAWEVGHMLEHIAKQEMGADQLRERLIYEKNTFPANSTKMLFTSNHDENSWSGSEFERFGDAVECMIALTYMLNGMPLIYSGQESGNKKRISFFDKDLIEWNIKSPFNIFYKELNKLKHNCKALDCAGEGGEIEYIHNSQTYNILSFKRIKGDSQIIAIFNLTPYHVQPAFWDGSYNGEWNKLFHGKQTLTEGSYDPFGPWEYKIYYR